MSQALRDAAAGVLLALDALIDEHDPLVHCVHQLSRDAGRFAAGMEPASPASRPTFRDSMFGGLRA